MDLEIEDLLLSPSSCNPSEPLSVTTINDPTFTRVDLIRKQKKLKIYLLQFLIRYMITYVISKKRHLIQHYSPILTVL